MYDEPGHNEVDARVIERLQAEEDLTRWPPLRSDHPGELGWVPPKYPDDPLMPQYSLSRNTAT
jgi:hypothetical protein